MILVETDRDMKRWMLCLCSMLKELEAIKPAKEILDKFQAVISTDGLNPGQKTSAYLTLKFPEGYKVEQELI